MFTPSIQSYLDSVKIPIRLSCLNKDGWPIVLSLWFVHLKGRIYCATKNSALVIGFLQNNPNCGFEIASDQPPYCGIRGRATARIDEARGGEILQILLDRYLGGKENRLAQLLLKNIDSEVAIQLNPVTVSSWNFSGRMQEFAVKGENKPCP